MVKCMRHMGEAFPQGFLPESSICVFDAGEQVHSSCRRVAEGWVEIEAGSICIFIDLYMLNESKCRVTSEPLKGEKGFCSKDLNT